jgi:hypothetical protein
LRTSVALGVGEYDVGVVDERGVPDGLVEGPVGEVEGLVGGTVGAVGGLDGVFCWFPGWVPGRFGDDCWLSSLQPPSTRALARTEAERRR